MLAADGSVQYNTPAITAVLGYEPEELQGRAAFDLMHPDDVPQVLERFATTLQQPGVAVPPAVR